MYFCHRIFETDPEKARRNSHNEVSSSFFFLEERRKTQDMGMNKCNFGERGGRTPIRPLLDVFCSCKEGSD